MAIRAFGLAILVLTLFLRVENISYSQSPQAASDDNRLATKPLNDVALEGSVVDMFSQLSLAYDIPIGLELASNEEELVHHRIHLEKGTVSDLMSQFIAQETRYAWDTDDGVLHVFPKQKFRDVLLGDLLAVRVARFSVKQNTSCWGFEKSLFTTPEIKTMVKANGFNAGGVNFSGFHTPQLGRNFALDVSNITLRAILDKVIRESPTARFWMIESRNADRTLFVRLSARFEPDAAIGNPRRIQRQRNHRPENKKPTVTLEPLNRLKDKVRNP